MFFVEISRLPSSLLYGLNRLITKTAFFLSELKNKCNFFSIASINTNSNILFRSQENQWGLLSAFVNAINESSIGDEFFSRLNQAGGKVTLFAPCSEVWRTDQSLRYITRDAMKFREILDLHLVVDNTLYVEKILKDIQKGVSLDFSNLKYLQFVMVMSLYIFMVTS